MEPKEFVTLLGEQRALAILRTSIESAAGPAMEAALRAGFRILEFTLDTPGALRQIGEFSRRDGLIVGAGTVLGVEQARAALRHGAEFLVSPVLDEAVIHQGLAARTAVVPGTFTATEMLRAHRAGAPLQKLFPSPGSGPAYVRACLGPMPFLRLVPTNGVDADNAPAWLRAGAHAVGFGNLLFSAADLAGKRFDRVEQRARAMLEAARSA